MATNAEVSSESEYSEPEINSDESDISTVEEQNFQGVVPYRFEPLALPRRQNRAENPPPNDHVDRLNNTGWYVR